MDKQKNITIKINGKDRTFKKAQLPEERKPQDSDKPKIKSWNETAAASEKGGEEFEWMIPESGKSDPAQQDQKAPQKKGVRFPAITKGWGNFSSLPPVILTVIVAILLGTGFGFIVLNTVKSEEPEEAAVSGNISKPEAAAGEAKPQGNGTIPAMEIFIVQGGVFSTIEAAETTSSELEAAGIPSIAVPSGDNYAVLLATAGTIEEAKEKGSELAANGAEVFARSYLVPEISLSGLSKGEAKVMELAEQLAPVIMKGGKGDSAAVEKMEDGMAKLKEIPEGDIADKNVQSLQKSLQSGVAAYLAFQASGAKEDGETLQMEGLELVKILLDRE